MRRHRLTLRQRRALRALGEQLREQDPGLAAQLDVGGAMPRGWRNTPLLRWWSAASGGVLLVLGVWLSVGSSLLAGLVLLGGAVLLDRRAAGAAHPASRTARGRSDRPG